MSRTTSNARAPHEGMLGRRLNLVQVFTLLSFLCISVGAVILGLVMSHECRVGFERLERALTGDYVRQQFREHFSDELFTDARSLEDLKTVKVLQKALSFAEIFRIKIYGPSGEILWSDEDRLVKRVFEDNESLRRALNGEVISEIGPTEREEHLYERSQTDMVQEVYVPIVSERTGVLLGVIEVYRVPKIYLEAVKRAVWQSWIVSVGGGICLYVVLLTVVRRAYRKEKRLERELQQYSQELLQETDKLNSIVGAVGAGLCVLDGQRRIVWCNGVLERWFGPGDGLLGQLCHEAFRGGAEGWAGCTSGAVEEAAGATRNELTGLLQGGEMRWFEVTATPIRDARDQVAQLMVLMVDITDRKAIEMRLVHAGKMAALGELSGSVAHEINNPIGVISLRVTNLLSILGPDVSESRIRTALEEIRHYAERVGRIASELLSFSRRSVGQRVPVDLRDVVQEAVELVKHRIAGTPIDCHLALGEAPSVVECDVNAIQQVVVNILNNAVDAMPVGGRLAISVSRTNTKAGERLRGRSALITIEDEGVGMEAHVRDRIFDFFFTTKDKGRGTGLGLPISRRIVAEHEGEIHVWSEEGKGTRFEVLLPFASGRVAAASTRVPLA